MSQEETKSFVIGLTDFRGRKVSPSEIPIDLFDTYFTDLKRFVVGDSKDKNISVKLEDGSIKMVFVGSISFISALEADVAMIRDGTAPVNNTRAKVALRLQAYAKNNAASIYFAEDTNMKLLEITPESEILKPKGIWTDFEDYVFGKIRAVGGASPNIHVVDENGNETKISSTEEKLRGYKENMLYSSKLVHFSAQRNLTTNEVRNRFLISIEDLPAYDADNTDFIITKDKNTFAKYAERARKSFGAKFKVVLFDDDTKFSPSLFDTESELETWAKEHNA